jgi:SAM-dependent methyltransferase
MSTEKFHQSNFDIQSEAYKKFTHDNEKNKSWRKIERPAIVDFFTRFASENGSASAQVLIAGCGAFREGDLLNKLGAPISHITGIDLSSQLLAHASHDFDKAKLVEGNVTTLPFANESFNSIISSMVINYLPRPAYTEFLSECSRVLKPDGYLFLHTPDYHWSMKNAPPLWVSNALTRPRKEKTPWGTQVTHYPKPDDDLCEPIIDRGLRIREVIYHSDITEGKKHTIIGRPYFNDHAFSWWSKRISIIAQKNPLSDEEYQRQKQFYEEYHRQTRFF